MVDSNSIWVRVSYRDGKGGYLKEIYRYYNPYTHLFINTFFFSFFFEGGEGNIFIGFGTKHLKQYFLGKNLRALQLYYITFQHFDIQSLNLYHPKCIWVYYTHFSGPNKHLSTKLLKQNPTNTKTPEKKARKIFSLHTL